ncbi:MAG TPA: AraC family transcriptional regulator [Xanthobacteraceae bacterium]
MKAPNPQRASPQESHTEAAQYSVFAEAGLAIAAELQRQTSAGRLLGETLERDIAARLIKEYIRTRRTRTIESFTREGLDRRRLSRVLDFIEANLQGDLTITRLAAIACLSRFHFARAFKTATGQSPHRYVCMKRLARAKAMLMKGESSLMHVALALGFSGQTNFTRAFRQLTGQTPGQYRRRLAYGS